MLLRTHKLPPFLPLDFCLLLSVFCIIVCQKVTSFPQPPDLGAQGAPFFPPPIQWACEHVFLGSRCQLAGGKFAYSAQSAGGELGACGGSCGKREKTRQLWSASGQVKQIFKRMARWQVEVEGGSGSGGGGERGSNFCTR